MAMTVRLPEQLDAQIAELAERMHTSKAALMVEAAEILVARYTRQAAVDRVVNDVLARDKTLFARLEDA
ncbi:ribbon-helix-helix protein, CopG family [Leifsonia sp. NPDC056665]|uniref:ribbon-helix-helix protein, CopG family n=1 Tax=Leifsonia sp. NPDC056665 TaxID=3345901 RepID=UPI00367E09CC